MADELAKRAFADLDEIAVEARHVLDALVQDDVETAQEFLTGIKQCAEAWEA